MKRTAFTVIFALILGILGQYAPAFAERMPRELRSAIRAYDRANFTEAAQMLEQFLAQADLAIQVKIEAMQYLAFCRVALNDPEGAKGIFSQILDLKADYRSPQGLSPKIGEVFEAALQTWQAAHPPTPPVVKAKAKTPVWQIVLGVGLLAALVGGGGGGGGGTSGIEATVQ